MIQRPSRPTGVGILAILDFIGGIILVLGGAVLAILGGSSVLSTYGYGAISGLAYVLGGIILVVGILALLIGWGLWAGKGWAWTLAAVLYALGALLSLWLLASGSASSIVNLLIYALLLWYLWRPHVKEFFGKEMPSAPVASTPPPPPPVGLR